jgi:hypothetical protein
MDLQTMFVIELVLGAVMLTVMVGLLLYLAMEHRRLRRETGRQVGTADIPVGLAPGELTERATPLAARHPEGSTRAQDLGEGRK